MKKIGILFGQENTFPKAFVDRINEKNIKGITAEFVKIDKVKQADPTEYAVIVDRISQDVPFYRAYLKNAAITGTIVINNPFWWSADEKFFNNALAEKIGVPVPKTVILPSSHRPPDTSENSFRNLEFPLAWDEIFEYVGFPAFMKPYSGGGWKSVYRLESKEEFFDRFPETGELTMMLQEEIVFDTYFRCYCLGTDNVHIMQYEPRNPFHERYIRELKHIDKKLLKKVEDYVIRLNKALGYDFNTVELAVRDGVPYAIDFCNPAPDADAQSVGQENFDWIIENAANMAIEKAKMYKKGQVNLTWGTFVSDSANNSVNGLKDKKAGKAVKKSEKDSTDSDKDSKKSAKDSKKTGTVAKKEGKDKKKDKESKDDKDSKKSEKDTKKADKGTKKAKKTK